MKYQQTIRNLAVATALFFGGVSAAFSGQTATMMDLATQSEIITAVESMMGDDVSGVLDGMVASGAFNPETGESNVILAKGPSGSQGQTMWDLMVAYNNNSLVCKLWFKGTGCVDQTQTFCKSRADENDKVKSCLKRGAYWYWDNGGANADPDKVGKCECRLDVLGANSDSDREQACKNIQSKISRTYCTRTGSPKYDSKDGSCETGMKAKSNQYRNACNREIVAAKNALPRRDNPPADIKWK